MSDRPGFKSMHQLDRIHTFDRIHTIDRIHTPPITCVIRGVEQLIPIVALKRFFVVTDGLNEEVLRSTVQLLPLMKESGKAEGWCQP